MRSALAQNSRAQVIENEDEFLICLQKHFLDLAFLLRLLNKNPFQIRAWKQAIRQVEVYKSDFFSLFYTHRLRAIKGIGPTIEKEIYEVALRGENTCLRQILESEIAPWFLQFCQKYPGIREELVFFYQEFKIAFSHQLLFLLISNLACAHDWLMSRKSEEIIELILNESEGIGNAGMEENEKPSDSAVFSGIYLYPCLKKENFHPKDQEFLLSCQFIFHTLKGQNWGSHCLCIFDNPMKNPSLFHLVMEHSFYEENSVCKVMLEKICDANGIFVVPVHPRFDCFTRNFLDKIKHYKALILFAPISAPFFSWFDNLYQKYCHQLQGTKNFIVNQAGFQSVYDWILSHLASGLSGSSPK